MEQKSFGEKVVVIIIVVGILYLIGLIVDATTPKCIRSGCDNEQASGSSYCYLHKPYSRGSSYRSYSSRYVGGSSSSNESNNTNSSSNSTANKSNTSNYNYSSGSSNIDSYDEGYEDIYFNEDYDEERYENDSDYANGVDDAMEDEDW